MFLNIEQRVTAKIFANHMSKQLSNTQIPGYKTILTFCKQFLFHKVIKTCVLYFLYFTKRMQFKNDEKCFLFHLGSSFRSQDIQGFFLFLYTVSRFTGSDETKIIITSSIGLHKLANVIFGKAQKLLRIKSSKLPG